ncbi:MAG: HAD family phosphatase [Acidimicrobiia bacterium]|nr:HAD family phosphatase [Acidimicrobiia bacterium]NNF63274.1 HAD family phosphatase [Acidimicrobiia bacterium]
MADITTLLFDVGGVILTNGWDTSSRQACIEAFDLDWDEFDDRHLYVAGEFETGRLTLDGYLDRTVFYKTREFTRDEFKAAMRQQSQRLPETLELVAGLSPGRLLATLNNESRELNEHRIRTFGLADVFTVFLSSCYLGVKKPDARIYEMALELTQSDPSQCVFVDDRAINLECANTLGINGILFENPTRLRYDLQALGVE